MIYFGNSSVKKIYFGTQEVKKIYLGNDLIYSSQPQLATPQNLSVTDTTASFDEVENAESYEFFVDDVSIGEYSTQTGYEVTLTIDSLWGGWYNEEMGTVMVYDGEDNTAPVVLSQVPANSSAYPITVTITSGHLLVAFDGPAVYCDAPTSSDYDAPTSVGYPAVAGIGYLFTINKNGSMALRVGDFDD